VFRATEACASIGVAMALLDISWRFFWNPKTDVMIKNCHMFA